MNDDEVLRVASEAVLAGEPVEPDVVEALIGSMAQMDAQLVVVYATLHQSILSFQDALQNMAKSSADLFGIRDHAKRRRLIKLADQLSETAQTRTHLFMAEQIQGALDSWSAGVDDDDTFGDDEATA
jgi:hypothetical protein